MSDDPRAPRHPSDMPSSRTTGADSSSSHPPGNIPYTPTPAPAPSGSNQTRNIVIGAVATIIASTTVYYLTQYVNLRKSDSASSASFPVVKQATVEAWSSFVTVDNIYYKNIKALGKNQDLRKDLNQYEVESIRETDKFIKDAENIIKDKTIDKTFVSLVKRRIKREKEVNIKISEFYAGIKSIAKTKLSKEEKEKKILVELLNPFLQYCQTVLEMSATEVEDLSKTLSEKFATSFDPMQFLVFADYKKGLFTIDTTSHHHHGDSLVAAKNVDPRKLVGNWNDDGNKLALRRDGTLGYSMTSGFEGSGVWKVDDDLLRLDAVEKISKLKSIYFFGLYNLTTDSFTIKLTSAPYDVYKFRKEKD